MRGFQRSDVQSLLGIALPPAATGAEVAMFEARLDIDLPEDYRSFVTRIAQGGLAPVGRLFPLGGWPLQHALGDLSRPFPHRGPWNPLLGPPDEEERAAALEWYGEPAQADGALPIGQREDGALLLLVVAGPERGRLWWDARVVRQGITPLGATFDDWYGSWLEELARRPSQCMDTLPA